MQAAAVHSPALELLRAFGDRPRLAKRGDTLIRLGETGVDILLMASGWACREHVRPNGNQAVLDLYLPGDLVGLDNLVDDDPNGFEHDFRYLVNKGDGQLGESPFYVLLGHSSLLAGIM